MTARRSVLVRLLAGAVLIALCSIAATAWLAARSTTVAIQEQQGQALADDAKIYDTLLGYAATHPKWSGVGKVISELSLQTGRQITLTTPSRTVIAGTTETLAPTPSTTIDPFRPDPALSPGDEQIDPRALGPFRLSSAAKAQQEIVAGRILNCVRGRTGLGVITTGPTGRPKVTGAQQDALDECLADTLQQVEGAAAKPDQQLQTLTNNCLAAKGPRVPIKLQGDLSWSFVRGLTSVASEPAAVAPIPDPEAVEACLLASRRTQLDPYVAPPALLFVSTPSRASAELDLSPANQKRIAGVAAAVLAITVLIAAVGGIRLVQPLRALTRASRQMTGGDENVRVKVRGTDEIGQLSLAFNELADSRARTEALRRAMVSDIAHELRTPLSNIRGWLEAVEDGVTQPDQAFIASLSEEAALLQHIIDDLRDLATADAGNLRIHPERVYLGLLLDQVAASHRAQAEQAGITLTSTTTDDIELDADPVRLRQAVGNLAANALRFTPPGGSVRIEGRREGGEVVIDVTDTGSGIAPEDLPKVFDRFWRAEQSRNRHTGGSGLGLAIVRSLIEAHGGTAGATSTVGQGSTFTLLLPTGA
jgi:two-component system, OmpR family, sensor histidine kinase BaeS